MDSTPVVAVAPPLRVDGVAIESATACAPLCSVGVTPPPRSYGGIRLPMHCRASSRSASCTALPLDERNASDLPSSRPCPVDVPRSSTPVGSWEPWPLAPWMWPSMLLSMSAPTSLFIAGLNPFTLAHCGPSTPCVRFAAVVAFGHATLGIRCLARASGAGTCPRPTRPSLARRTSNGTKNVKVPYVPIKVVITAMLHVPSVSPCTKPREENIRHDPRLLWRIRAGFFPRLMWNFSCSTGFFPRL
jgi:hypothetical protein